MLPKLSCKDTKANTRFKRAVLAVMAMDPLEETELVMDPLEETELVVMEEGEEHLLLIHVTLVVVMTMPAGMPLFSRTLVVVMTKHAGKLTVQKQLEEDLEVMRTNLVKILMMPAGMPSLRILWEVVLLLLLVLKMMMPAGMPKDREWTNLVKIMMMPAGLPSLGETELLVMEDQEENFLLIYVTLVVLMTMTAGVPLLIRNLVVLGTMKHAGMPSLG
jgi:hypothetical protein